MSRNPPSASWWTPPPISPWHLVVHTTTDKSAQNGGSDGKKVKRLTIHDPSEIVFAVDEGNHHEKAHHGGKADLQDNEGRDVREEEGEEGREAVQGQFLSGGKQKKRPNSWGQTRARGASTVEDGRRASPASTARPAFWACPTPPISRSSRLARRPRPRCRPKRRARR